MELKNLLRGICLLSCAKKGYISIKKASKKLGWNKQKVVAVGNLLVEHGILTKNRYAGCYYEPRLDGYYVEI